MTETRHSLNPEPRNVLVKVKSRRVVTGDRAYHFGELFRTTEDDARALVAAGHVEEVAFPSKRIARSWGRE